MSNFFEDLNLDNAARGEKPYFQTGEEVVLGVNSIEEKTGDFGVSLNVDCKVLNTNHEGKELTLRLDPAPKSETKKNMLVGVLSALYGDNWQTTARNNLAVGVGKKIKAIALEAGEFNGNKFQHFTAIKPVTDDTKATNNLNSLAF